MSRVMVETLTAYVLFPLVLVALIDIATGYALSNTFQGFDWAGFGRMLSRLD